MRAPKVNVANPAATSPADASPSWGHRVLDLADGFSGACIGFAFYGLWTLWANHQHGLDIAIRAAILHGSLSFIVTYSGTWLMKTLYNLPGPTWWRFGRSVLGTLISLYTLIVSAHWLNGTPEILLTLAPGIPITVVFCLSFCWGLSRYGHNHNAPDLRTLL